MTHTPLIRLAIVVAALVCLIPPAGAAAKKAKPECFVDHATKGTTFRNNRHTVIGTPKDDVIIAGHVRNGTQHIFGLGGDDTICGDGGDGEISRSDDDDVIKGGDGKDRIDGGGGFDDLDGGKEHDEVLAGPESGGLNHFDGDDVPHNTLTGGAGPDLVIGSNANDSLAGGFQDDAIDTIVGHGSGDFIDGQGGADVVAGSAGDDQIFSDGPDDVDGGPGLDQCLVDNSLTRNLPPGPIKNCEADLAVDIEAPQVVSGEGFTVTYRVRNLGPSKADNYSLFIDAPVPGPGVNCASSFAGEVAGQPLGIGAAFVVPTPYKCDLDPNVSSSSVTFRAHVVPKLAEGFSDPNSANDTLEVVAPINGQSLPLTATVLLNRDRQGLSGPCGTSSPCCIGDPSLNAHIRAGGTVTWQNNYDNSVDQTPGLFTVEIRSAPSSPQQFTLTIGHQGGTGSVTFPNPGTYSYVCDYEFTPDAQGTIQVG